jgi:hypothetical protein
MNVELKGIKKEAVIDYFKGPSSYSPLKRRKSLVRESIEIQIERLSNTS